MLWTDATKRDEVIQEHDDHKVESFKRSPLLIRQLAYQRAYQHWLKKKLQSFCALQHRDSAGGPRWHGRFFCLTRNSFQVTDDDDDDNNNNVYFCHVDYANDDMPEYVFIH